MRASFVTRRPAAAAPSRRASLVSRADSVLIANTKGGGHAFLGLHLAKKLMSQGHKVTILNDGDEVRRRERELRYEENAFYSHWSFAWRCLRQRIDFVSSRRKLESGRD